MLYCLFRRRLKKTSKLHVTGLCEGNPSVTDGFPSQRASNAGKVSIWWRLHDLYYLYVLYWPPGWYYFVVHMALTFSSPIFSVWNVSRPMDCTPVARPDNKKGHNTAVFTLCELIQTLWMLFSRNCVAVVYRKATRTWGWTHTQCTTFSVEFVGEKYTFGSDMIPRPWQVTTWRYSLPEKNSFISIRSIISILQSSRYVTVLTRHDKKLEYLIFSIIYPPG